MYINVSLPPTSIFSSRLSRPVEKENYIRILVTRKKTNKKQKNVHLIKLEGTLYHSSLVSLSNVLSILVTPVCDGLSFYFRPKTRTGLHVNEHNVREPTLSDSGVPKFPFLHSS